MKKSEKGSISLYVLVSMLFFLIFAVTTYIGMGNSRATQLKAQARIKEIYEKDINNLDEVYDSVLDVITMELAEEILPSPIVTVGGNVSAVVDNVPIPTGFTHLVSVGSTRNNGIVIQDGSGNQFVWVPAVAGSKVLVTTTYKNSEEATKKWAEGNRNTTYFAGGTVGETIVGDSFVVPQGGTYTVYAKNKNGKEAVEIINTTKSKFKRGTFGMTQVLAEESTVNAYWDNKSDPIYIAMIASVNKYGGFYIARYQASYNNGVAASKQSTESYNGMSGLVGTGARTAAPTVNGQLWNYSSQTNAITVCSNMYSGTASVVAHLPWGIEYDSILQWLKETVFNNNDAPLGTNSTSWGNYFVAGPFTYDNGTKAANVGILINTGSAEYTKKNNIYDIAGNLREWTQEKYSNVVGPNFCAYRGEAFYDLGAGEIRPAAYRTFMPGGNSDANVGFRPALYIK